MKKNNNENEIKIEEVIEKNKFMESLKDFFKKDIKKKLIIIFILSIVLMISFSQFNYISNKSFFEANKEEISKVVIQKSFFDIFKSRIYILAMTFVAGIVPYFFIPVLGFILYLYNISYEFLVKILEVGGLKFSFLSLIPIFLDLISISIVTSIGIYFSVMSSKRFKYSSTKNYTFLNLKHQVCEMLGKEELLKKTKKQIEIRDEKQQKNNVKIKYLEMLALFGVVVLIQTISIFIEVLI